MHIQRFAQWGLQAELMVYDTVDMAKGIGIEALGFGTAHTLNYEWPGTDLEGKGPHWIRTDRDTMVTLVVSDEVGTVPDTAWVLIKLGDERADLAWATRDRVTIERGGSGGSSRKYCGGFEVALDDYRNLIAVDDRIYTGFLDETQRTVTVQQRFPEIFAWLGLLDTNVIVVIVLMVIVAIINMTSALLIIILERTNMIGVLKALGTGDGAIRRIFLIDAAYILGFGIILGDVLGIGLALVQKHTGLVRLPVESYYVDQVPVDLEIWPIAALNIGTLLVCVLALVIPSMMVSRIAPAKAIRFE